MCSVWQPSTGPNDESSLISTAGNALAAHTRSEIDPDGLGNTETNTFVTFGGFDGSE